MTAMLTPASIGGADVTNGNTSDLQCRMHSPGPAEAGAGRPGELPGPPDGEPIVARGQAHDHEVRRLYDQLRSAVLRAERGAAVPSEYELMSSYGATRGTVRAALSLLRASGLLERRPGLGTHTVAVSTAIRLEEAHGAVSPSPDSLLNQRLRARVIQNKMTRAGPPVADRLEVAIGTPCLRLEYVNLLDDEPVSLATNYVVEPEAGRLRQTPFVSDWYALLAAAGCPLGDSQLVWDAVLADPVSAPLLGLQVGQPVMAMEQVVHDPLGRPFNVAFIRLRADRWRLVSRFWRQPK